jgi:hypothetical protein
MSVWIGDRVNGHKVETIFSRDRMVEGAQPRGATIVVLI